MKLNKLGSLLLGIVLAIAFIGCDKSDGTKDDGTDTGGPENKERVFFNVVIGTSTGQQTEIYVQAFEDLTKGEVSVVGYGYELPSTRTARVIASSSGEELYNLHYGGGIISKYFTLGGQNYTEIGDLTFKDFMGTEHARWTKIDDGNALLHSIRAGDVVTTSNGGYKESHASILKLDLTYFSFGAAPVKAKKFEIARTDYDDAQNTYVSRIDAPAVVGGKAYYGMMKAKYDPATGNTVKGFNNYPSTTLVLDYPSLENPKLISSKIGTGQNYGYRMPIAHVYQGSVYQLSSEPAHILKMTNGAYDDTYDFDLAAALNIATGVGARGWFYTGNGIGYALYYDSVLGSTEEAGAWGVARVDLVNKTAIKMNVPTGLYLFQYQNAAIGKDGKLYMALAPVGKEGNIYIFDPKNETADGFTVGAKLKTGAGISYIGIF